MKKNQVDSILVNQTKRRNTVLALSGLIVIIFIISFSLFVVYNKINKDYEVTYTETGNVDYDVFLHENNFFENNFLENDKQYISSLVDYIDTKFNYSLSLDNDYNVNYNYSYDIIASVNVIQENTGKSLYNITDTLTEQKTLDSSSTIVNINEIVRVNYNYYNDLIKQFITVYELTDIKANLSIIFRLNVNGSCNGLEDNNKNVEMTANIPLATNTLSIDVSDNLVDNGNNIIKCKNNNHEYFFLVILGSILILINLCLIAYTIKYEIKTRTAENIYEKEMKKILNNYSSYIQTMYNDFDFTEYQMLKINTFNDMLEIRDTIRQPILMKENQDKTGAYFMIPSNSKILYVYRLDVRDIKNNTQN